MRFLYRLFCLILFFIFPIYAILVLILSFLYGSFSIFVLVIEHLFTGKSYYVREFKNHFDFSQSDKAEKMMCAYTDLISYFIKKGG
jgi:hypothetical protein